MAASVLSCGMFSTRAMSFPVPEGTMPSGTFVPATRFAPRFTMPSPPTTTSASGLVFTAARADSSSSTQLGSVSDWTSCPSARNVCTSAGPISDLAPNDADGLIATTTRFGFTGFARLPVSLGLLDVTVGPFVAPAVAPD